MSRIRLLGSVFLLFTLVGCGDYTSNKVVSYSLPKEGIKKLILVSRMNFICGYLGKYHAEYSTSSYYHHFLDNGDFLIKTLLASKIDGNDLDKRQTEFIKSIKPGMASALRDDLSNIDNSIEIETMINTWLNTLNNRTSNCQDVTTYTRLIIDRLIEEKIVF
ncbi:hypothetical protein SAMN03080615_00069 [Amphritea atlantica]|uniref:Uncharacterized protein n=1 Tax=Amphritea atlantica TaxID=355243 RepID=A0A1H9CN32_9GAMM|nr:hypothetical protein [Amphritea atlantica]SEQ02574.1 hypothetical protein SAMN03080615_00069 [Amphritea atlantica]